MPDNKNTQSSLPPMLSGDELQKQMARDTVLAKREVLKNQEKMRKSSFGTKDANFHSTPIDFEGVGLSKPASGKHSEFFYNSWSDNTLANLLPGGKSPTRDTSSPWGRYVADDNFWERAAREQTAADLTYDVIMGGGKQLVAGFLDNAASWDMSDMSNWQTNKGMDMAGNWLQQLANKFKQSAQTENQIFQAGDDMMSAAYWANQAQSFGYTAGITLEMLAEQVALAIGTGGTGNVGGILKNIKTGTGLAKQALMGLAGGVRESYMNARETGENIYRKLKEDKYSEEEARKYAGEAAAAGFKTEVGPLIAINAIQNMALFSGKFLKSAKPTSAFTKGAETEMKFGFSDMAETAMEKLMPNVENKWARRGIKYGVLTPGSEAVEETIQTAAGQWGQYQGNQKALDHKISQYRDLASRTKDPIKLKEYSKAIADLQAEKAKAFEFDEIEIRDSAVGGYFGGMLLGAGAKFITNWGASKRKASFAGKLEKFMTEAPESTKNMLLNIKTTQQDLVEALTRHNKEGSSESLAAAKKAAIKATKAQNDSQANIIVQALAYDMIKGEGTKAYDQVLSNLEAQYEAAMNDDKQALKDHYILKEDGSEIFEGAIEHIKENFGKHIEQAKFIRTKLDDILLNKTSNFDAAVEILQHEFDKNEAIIGKGGVKEMQEGINTFYNTDNFLSQMSSEGQSRFKLENERQALLRIKRLNKNFSALNEQRLEEINTELESIPGYKAADEALRKNMQGNRPKYVEAHMSEIMAQHEVDTYNEKIAKASEEKYIKDKIKNKTSKKIREAKTKEEVDTALEDAEKAKLKIEEEARLKKEAEEKLKALAAGKAKNTGKIATAPGAKAKAESTTSKPVVNGLSALAQLSKASIGTAPSQEEINGLMSRKNIPTEPTAEQTEAVEGYFDLIAEELGVSPKDLSFEEVVKDHIERTSLDTAKRDYNAIALIWERGGRDFSSDLDTIYDRFFSRDKRGINALAEMSQGSITPEESKKLNKKSIKKAKKKTSKKAAYNPNLETYETIDDFDETDSRTSNSDLKFAYNFADFTRDPETLQWVRNSYGLKPFEEGEVVDNHYILDKDFLDEIIKTEPNSLKLRVLDLDDIPVGKTTWGQMKEENKATKSGAFYEDWYNQNVPVVVVYEGKFSNNEATPLAMIHTASWYSALNVSDRNGNQEEVIQKGRENVRNLRKELAEVGSASGLGIKISSIGFGSIDSTDSDVLFSVSKAAPSSRLGIFRLHEKKYEFNLGTEKISSDKILNFESLKEQLNAQKSSFFVVHINEAHVDPVSGPKYMAVITMQNSPNSDKPNLKGDLPSSATTNLKVATMASMLLSNPDNVYLQQRMKEVYDFTMKDAERVAETINKDLKISITDNLRGYYQLFVNTLGTVGERDADFKATLESKEEGITHFQAKYPTQITMGQKGQSPIKLGGKIVNETKGRKTDEEIVNLQIGNLTRAFGEQGLVKKTKLNTNMKFLNKTRDNKITLFNNQGQVDREAGSYDEYLKTKLKTDVITHKIETITGEQKDIIDVQPMIYFETQSGSTKAKPTVEQEEQVKDKKVKKAKKVKETEQDTDVNDTEIEAEHIDLNEMFKATEEALRQSGLSEEEIAMAKANFMQAQDPLASRKNDFSVDSLYNEKSNKISQLTNTEQDDLVNALKHMIIANLDFNGNIKQQIQEGIQNKLVEYINPKLESQKKVLAVMETMPGQEKTVAKIKANIFKLESILEQQGKLNNFTETTEEPLGVLVKEFNALLGTNFEEELNLSDNDQEESYSRSFLEKDLKLSFSSQLRLSLFGFQEKDRKGAPIVNTLGFNRFAKAEDTYLRLMDVTTTIPNSWDKLMSALDNKAEEIKTDNIYTAIKAKFEVLPQHLKNELLHRTISKKFTAYKVLNKVEGEIWDKESGETIPLSSSIQLLEEGISDNKIIKNRIVNGLLSSDFATTSEDNTIILNKVYTESVLKDISKVIADKEENPEVLKDLFDRINLEEISLDAIKYYIDTENTSDGDLPGLYGKAGLLTLLNRKFRTLLKANPSSNISLEKDNPFKDVSRALSGLINSEVFLNGVSISPSVRVADKTLQGVIANTSLHDINQLLISENYAEVLADYLKVPQNQFNEMLQMLSEDEEGILRRMFAKIGFSSPEAYKLDGKSSDGQGDIDKISLQDILATKLGVYMNKESQASLPGVLGNSLTDKTGLTFKMGQMASHTLSDKGRVMFLTSLLVDFIGDEVVFGQDGQVSLNGDLNSYLVQQIFESELNRIIQSYKQDTNLTAYDISSKVFHYLPSLNAISIETPNGPINIHDLLFDTFYGSPNAELSPEDLDAIREEAGIKIASYINSEVNSKITADGLSGDLVEQGFFSDTEARAKRGLSPFVNLDSTYMTSKERNNHKSPIETMRYTMAEYVINNLLHNINTHALYLGDISFYSKDKFIPTTNAVDEFGGVTGIKIDAEKIAQPENYVKMATSIGAALDKRTASLIAPGLKLADSENPNSKFAQEFIHIAVNDVEDSSSVIKNYVEMAYGPLNEEQQEAWNKLEKALDIVNTSEVSKEVKDAKEVVKKLVGKYFPDISDYFNITGTDAQEYTTWRTHLDLLFRQGSKITEEQYNNLMHKLSNNIELNEEEQQVFFQPVKPVYTNLVFDPEFNIMRPVYIKSSAFPLIPQMTKNLELDNARLKLESLENSTGAFTPVRMSYQTANKIGSVNTNLTMKMLYSNDPIPQEALDSAKSILPLSGFRIQQETPSKEDKFFDKQKDAYISMGSQFMKIILGNFINADTNPIFANTFNSDILEAVGIKHKNNLSGVELDQIYNHVYFEFSDLLKDNLETELGLRGEDFYNLTIPQQNRVLESLQQIIEKEATERGYPDYLAKTVQFVDTEAERLEILNPLFFDVNTHKFEALLQSLIASRLITHKLPGNGHIVGSSEGFRKKVTLDELTGAEKQGIVWINGIEEQLTPTYLRKDVDGRTSEVSKIEDDGAEYTLMKSKVLIKSHYKYTDADGVVKYVDLTNTDPFKGPVYAINILDEDGKIIGKKLDLNMIEPELLAQFSFRIPTSSHQSGAIIEVAGFLPPMMKDLLVVPKEHTTQLGEDFDIDKRYVYKSNYAISPTGKIEKLRREHIDIMKENNVIEVDEKLEDLALSLRQETSPLKRKLRNQQRVLGEDRPSNEVVEDIMKSLFGDAYSPNTALVKSIQEKAELLDEIYDLYRANKGSLINAGKAFQRKVEKKYSQKLLENALIDVYKSVYLTTDNEIQKTIFKPLTTDVAEDTSEAMDRLLQSAGVNPDFSVMSDKFQTELIKIGADGKGGIGVHSNAVTFEAQLQRLIGFQNKVVLGDYKQATAMSEPSWTYFRQGFDGLEFKSTLGANKKTLDGARNIADQHGENQNVSTDNINKQIMGKRNENSYTMGVYALMAHMGFDLSSTDVNTGFVEKGELVVGKMHIPSLVLNQPILRDFVATMEKYNSITASIMSQEDKKKKVIEELGIKYGFISTEDLIKDDFEYKYEGPSNLTGVSAQKLWDNLIPENALRDETGLQEAILNAFLEMDKKAKEVSKIQQLFNISTSKLGISYFETLNRIDTLNEVGYNAISAKNDKEQGYIPTGNNYENLIGEVTSVETEGFTKVGRYYWKPTTIEGKMLINSLSVADRLMPIFFPYNSSTIQNIVDNIFMAQLADPTVKSSSNLQWKYEIMSSFKDYMSSNIGTFNDSLENERRRLFFDNKTLSNTSLGSILKDLKSKGHPIMSNRLLKDLEVTKNIQNGVVVIKHATDDSTVLDKSSKYEAFLDLLKDTTKLGEYNGEMLTVSQLAQDLVTYSFLADNQNGATGFKNFVNVEYLNVIGVTKNFREAFKQIQQESLEVGNFQDQYFQHHPERAKLVSAKNMKKLENSTGDKPMYVVQKDDKITTTSKKYKLFKYDSSDNKYKPLVVLGTQGFNEYDSSKEVQTSTINSTKGDLVFNSKGKKYVISDKGNLIGLDAFRNTLESPAFSTVEGILKSLYSSGNTNAEVKQFIKEFEPYINNDVKVVWSRETDNWFDYENNTIHLNSNMYSIEASRPGVTWNEAQLAVREILMEEIIHSITYHELNQYLEFADLQTGDVQMKEDAPQFVRDIVNAYEIARFSVPYDPNDDSTYYSKNIFEFLAGMYVAPDYRMRLEAQESGFIENFLRSIRKMFEYLQKLATGKQVEYKDVIFGYVDQLLQTNRENFGNKGITLTENPLSEMFNDKPTEFRNTTPKRPLENGVEVEPKGESIVKETAARTATLKVMDKIAEKTNRLQLTEDGQFYEDLDTGVKYARVTQFTKDSPAQNDLLKSSQAVGNKVDEFIRDFFDNNLGDMSQYDLSGIALLQEFVTELQDLKEAFEERGEVVISKGITLHNEELGLAGTVDLLTIDNDGKVRIYDIKSKRAGTKYLSEGSSDIENWTDQLSLYRILLNNTYGIKAEELGIEVVKVMYNAGDTKSSELRLAASIHIDMKDSVTGKDGRVAQLKDFEALKPKGESKQGFKQEIKPGVEELFNILPTIGDTIPFRMPNGDNITVKIVEETNDMYTIEFPDGTKEEISPMELGFTSWETSKGLKRASSIKKSIWEDVSKSFQNVKYNIDNLKNSKFNNIYNKIKDGQEVVSKDFANIEEFKEFINLLNFTYKGKELPLLYHGSQSLFSSFKEEFLGKYTDAPSAKQAFFAAKDLHTASAYGELRSKVVGDRDTLDGNEYIVYEANKNRDITIDFIDADSLSSKNKSFKNTVESTENGIKTEIKSNIYPLFFISDNTLISDVKGNRKNIGSISKVLKDAKEENYDSVIFKDIYDGGFGGNTDVYTVFSSKQIVNVFDLINSQSNNYYEGNIKPEPKAPTSLGSLLGSGVLTGSSREIQSRRNFKSDKFSIFAEEAFKCK